MPSRAELLCVDPAHVKEFWPHAKDLINRAIRKTDLGHTEEIERSVLSGDLLLWITWTDRIEAAAVTSLTATDIHKVCTLVACAGTGDWKQLLPTIEQYAKDEGCAAFRIYGRKGWLRALEGYRLKHVIIEKRL